MLTDYHAKFFAHDLSSHNVEGVGRLSRAPHSKIHCIEEVFYERMFENTRNPED